MLSITSGKLQKEINKNNQTNKAQNDP